MRPHRVVLVAVLCVVVVSGCAAPQRYRTSVSGGLDTPAAHPSVHAPAPANPDLATVMERFYQQVEGAHWRFAYAMLSRRYRATMKQDDFIARYDNLTELDVSLLQSGDRVVVAALAAKERGSAAPARRFEETTTLAWDGEDWRIDRIVRRGVSAARTR